MNIQWPQIIMAIVYMAALVVIGLIMSRRIKSSDDYWVGGRSVGPISTAISYCAAYYSTVAIVGAVPLYYMYGIGYHALETIGCIFFTGVIIFIFVGVRMRAISERVGAVSLPGFLANRFDCNTIRLLGGLVIAFMAIPYAVSVLKGIADAMTAIAGIPYIVGVLALALVALFYLVSSGYWGVATTDLIQGITIAVAVFVLAAVGVVKAGGVSNIFATINEQDASLLSMPGPLSWAQIFSYAWVWALIAFGQPQLTTKFMGLKDGRTMKTVVRASVIWMFIFAVANMLVAGSARVIYGGAISENIDLLAPQMALDVGGIGISGIFLCGAIAAGLSTLVALVLTSSSAVCKDIVEDYAAIKKGSKSNVDSVKFSRIVTAIIFVISIALAIRPWDFVWSMSTMAAGAMGSAFTAPMILGLYWKRATKEGCIASVVGGCLVAVVWYLLGLTDLIHSFVPGTLAGFVLMVVVSLMTKPMDEKKLALYFG